MALFEINPPKAFESRDHSKYNTAQKLIHSPASQKGNFGETVESGHIKFDFTTHHNDLRTALDNQINLDD